MTTGRPFPIEFMACGVHNLGRAVVTDRIQYDTRRLAAACLAYGDCRLSLFGSVLRDGFGPASDVDVLVEFAPERTPGLKFFTSQAELSDLLGRTVAVNMPEDLLPSFGGDVLRAAEVQYEATLQGIGCPTLNHDRP